MAVDTPATIAVIGAGPIGLEAALYARFLGYDVRIYERQRLVAPFAQDRALAIDEPWGAYVSPLGVAAISAQKPDWQPPDATTVATAGALAEHYYLPLAATDLLADCIYLGTTVARIERDLAADDPPPEPDDVVGFRLHLEDAEGTRIETADVVIDASGCPPQRPVAVPQTADPEELGCRSDHAMYGSLQLANLATAGIDRVAANDPARLLTPEADFYVLGVKSATQPESFRIADGLRQVRDLFTIIADRANLDLYAAMGAGNRGIG